MLLLFYQQWVRWQMNWSKAKEINPNPSRRDGYVIVTTGEQTSVSLMAMAMDSLGVLLFPKCIPGSNAYNCIQQCKNQKNRYRPYHDGIRTEDRNRYRIQELTSSITTQHLDVDLIQQLHWQQRYTQMHVRFIQTVWSSYSRPKKSIRG